MLSKELVAQIAKTTKMSKTKTEELLAATVSSMMDALREGKDVQLQGLGILEVRDKNERTIVNPKTQERTTIPAGKKLSFRPAATIKEELK